MNTRYDRYYAACSNETTSNAMDDFILILAFACLVLVW